MLKIYCLPMLVWYSFRRNLMRIIGFCNVDIVINVYGVNCDSHCRTMSVCISGCERVSVHGYVYLMCVSRLMFALLCIFSVNCWRVCMKTNIHTQNTYKTRIIVHVVYLFSPNLTFPHTCWTKRKGIGLGPKNGDTLNWISIRFKPFQLMGFQVISSLRKRYLCVENVCLRSSSSSSNFRDQSLGFADDFSVLEKSAFRMQYRSRFIRFILCRYKIG